MAAGPPRVQGPAPKRASPPEPLDAGHDLTAFDNGKHPSLNEWLRECARASEGLSARTYVACDVQAPKRVVGYYAIATALEQRSALPSAKLRRGMPDQIPLLLIGRLAVDKAFQGFGLGSSLLVDALRRCHAASGIAGVRGVVTHASDDEAVQFYEEHGFARSPLGERVMLIAIETIGTIFDSSR
jgi:GNAT superfamily N-acetyltransferase